MGNKSNAAEALTDDEENIPCEKYVHKVLEEATKCLHSNGIKANLTFVYRMYSENLVEGENLSKHKKKNYSMESALYGTFQKRNE